MKRYSISIFLALLLHAIVVWALSGSWEDPDINSFKPPQHVKAKLVVLPKEKIKVIVKAKSAPASNNKKIAADKKKKADAAAKKKADAKKKAEATAKKKAVDKKASDLKIADAKKKAEELTKQNELEEKARLEKKRLEETRLAEELEEKVRLEEEIRLQELADQEGNLFDSLDQEDSDIEAAAVQASQDEVDAMTYYQLIQRQISMNWSRPPSTRNGMTIGMEIHLLPNGELKDVFITQSSGDDATDLSAERAVRKVSRFQVPDDIRLFELKFRKIEFGFRPEDLRQ